MDHEKLSAACAAIAAFFSEDEIAKMENSDWRSEGQTFYERVEGYVLGVIESLEDEIDTVNEFAFGDGCDVDEEDLDDKREPLLQRDEEGYAKVWVVLCRISDCSTPGMTFVDVMASEESARLRAQGHREALEGGTGVGTVVVVPTVIQRDNSIDGDETIL